MQAKDWIMIITAHKGKQKANMVRFWLVIAYKHGSNTIKINLLAPFHLFLSSPSYCNS
uniref:Uncharacterized protein n=1 Tax=Rhizophora mucronata TaxID=61149 RepID=A0A2P2PTW7_RHIMU